MWPSCNDFPYIQKIEIEQRKKWIDRDIANKKKGIIIYPEKIVTMKAQPSIKEGY